MRDPRWFRALALVCVGSALVLVTPAQAQTSTLGPARMVPVDWQASAEAVPQEAGSVYDSVASRVQPVLSWSYAEMQRLPGLFYEGKDLVMAQLDRLRNLPGVNGPDYGSLHKL